MIATEISIPHYYSTSMYTIGLSCIVLVQSTFSSDRHMDGHLARNNTQINSVSPRNGNETRQRLSDE